MALTMSRIDRLFRTYTLTATDENGVAVSFPGVDFALVPVDTGSPANGTTWTAGTAAGADWRVLLAGPDADPASAIVVPPWGGDLWIRATDTPEVIAVKVDRVTVS